MLSCSRTQKQCDSRNCHAPFPSASLVTRIDGPRLGGQYATQHADTDYLKFAGAARKTRGGFGRKLANIQAPATIHYKPLDAFTLPGRASTWDFALNGTQLQRDTDTLDWTFSCVTS